MVPLFSFSTCISSAFRLVNHAACPAPAMLAPQRVGERIVVLLRLRANMQQPEGHTAHRQQPVSQHAHSFSAPVRTWLQLCTQPVQNAITCRKFMPQTL